MYPLLTPRGLLGLQQRTWPSPDDLRGTTRQRLEGAEDSSHRRVAFSPLPLPYSSAHCMCLSLRRVKREAVQRRFACHQRGGFHVKDLLIGGKSDSANFVSLYKFLMEHGHVMECAEVWRNSDGCNKREAPHSQRFSRQV